MDPKTDVGMIATPEDHFDVPGVESLLPEEVVWIMDQLLSREVYPPVVICNLDVLALWESFGTDIVHMYLFGRGAVEFQFKGILRISYFHEAYEQSAIYM